MDSLTRTTLIHTISFHPPQKIPSSLPPILLSSLHQSKSKSKYIPKLQISSNLNPITQKTNPILQTLQNSSKVLIFTTATALMLAKFSQFPAKAEPPVEVTEQQVQNQEFDSELEPETPLSEFLESNLEAIEALKGVLQKKLEDGDDEEALKILRKLSSAQPLEMEWKFLMARLYNEIGEKGEARRVYEDILEKEPLCFDALFQTAVLMDQCGEGEAALGLLEEKLKLAREEEKESEARDVRLILAQIQYLQRNVEAALRSYEELAGEDPEDYRPYFYQFVIYSLLDRNEEAKVQFAKCKEVCPKDFKVEGFLQTPLSRVKLFGSDLDN